MDISTGSGIVHLSPANGEKDFEIVCKKKSANFCSDRRPGKFHFRSVFFANTFVRDADLQVVKH